MNALIICTGWSLTRKQIVDAICNYDIDLIIAVNAAVKLCPEADVLYVCDGCYIENNKDLWSDFNGIKLTVHPDQLPESWGWVQWRGADTEGASHHLGTLNFNFSGGAQAINYAALRGADDIYLLGVNLCDDPSTKRKSRFCSDYKGCYNGKAPYEKQLQGFKNVICDISSTVINLTPNSALRL